MKMARTRSENLPTDLGAARSSWTRKVTVLKVVGFADNRMNIDISQKELLLTLLLRLLLILVLALQLTLSLALMQTVQLALQQTLLLTLVQVLLQTLLLALLLTLWA